MLRILAIVVCLPVLAVLGYLASGLGEWTTLVLIALLLVWVAVLIREVVKQSKVACPQCQGAYSRGKYLSNCPHCGLRMLQENP